MPKLNACVSPTSPHRTTLPSRKSMLASLRIPLVVMLPSVSARLSAPSWSVWPTRWWWRDATTARSWWLSASSSMRSRSSTCWPTQTRCRFWSPPSWTPALARTPPESVVPVPFVARPLMSHPFVVSTRFVAINRKHIYGNGFRAVLCTSLDPSTIWIRVIRIRRGLDKRLLHTSSGLAINFIKPFEQLINTGVIHAYIRPLDYVPIVWYGND